MTHVDMTKERRIGSNLDDPDNDVWAFEVDQQPPTKNNAPLAWLWVILFGGFYFMFKGRWGHGVLCIALSIMTHGLSNIVYAILAGRIINAGR